jgi:hypothetical protein
MIGSTKRLHHTVKLLHISLQFCSEKILVTGDTHKDLENVSKLSVTGRPLAPQNVLKFGGKIEI